MTKVLILPHLTKRFSCYASFLVVDGVGLDLFDDSGDVGDGTVWVPNVVIIRTKDNADVSFDENDSLETNDEWNPPG